MPIALGLMSGTSCDGVSAALAEFRGRAIRVLAHATTAYPAPVAALLRRPRELTTPAIAQLNVLVGELFAQAALRLIRRSGISPRRIAAIGSHGQTIYHGPREAIPCTLQIGEPAIIAERTGLPVVADFRMRDLSAGGEGAPLMPFFDAHFYGSGAPRALQNLGGIGNVTLVGRGIAPIAFDTGPANCLLDLVARRITRGRQPFDRSGRLAARGRVDSRLLDRLLDDPYFDEPPPKSTGPERFNDIWLQRRCGRTMARRPFDLLATLTRFTAETIASSYRRFLPAQPREVIVSGGGCRNRALMAHLAKLLAPTPIRPIDAAGSPLRLPAQAKEPVAFAFFGLRAIRGEINHLPAATGASAARILGTITPATPASRTATPRSRKPPRGSR